MAKRKTYSFDSRCMDLALYFLPEEIDRQSDHAKELAQTIQGCVEAYLSDIEERAKS